MAALAKTRKYIVWSPSDGDIVQMQKAPIERNANSVVLIGGRKVTVSDIARVAALMYAINLDVSTIEKIDADLASSKDLIQSSFKELTTLQSNDNIIYDVALCRAAVTARIVSLMQGRSRVRSVVMECLVELLDANIVPNFSSPELAGLELCAVLTGCDGSCYMDGEIVSIKSAYEQSGLTPVGLTSSEFLTLQFGQFWTTGCSCLIAAGAANILLMIDSVSALSCDSYGASVEPFDAGHFDTCRQHRGQITSAANLRLLLEGSKRTCPSSINPAFCSIPQINGPIQDSVQSIVK